MTRPARDILLIGGSGVVGGRLAARLAPWYPDRVVVGGRRPDAAERAAQAAGHGARAIACDLTDAASLGAALYGASVVVTCVGQDEPRVQRACAERGIACTDLAPALALRPGPGPGQMDELDALARTTGARILSGAGLSPGISSVMAAALAAGGGATRIEIALLFGLGDEFGPDSLAFLLEEATHDFEIRVDGATQRVRPFAGARTIAFPSPHGRRRAWLFPFSDPVTFPRTLGARTALARLAIDPPWVGELAMTLARARVLPWLREHGLGGERDLVHLLARRVPERDGFAVVVEVEGPAGVHVATLAGRHQAEATALGAALAVRALDDGTVPPGVWATEQVIPPGPFLAELAHHGLAVHLAPGSMQSAAAAAP